MRSLDRRGLKFAHIIGVVAVLTIILQATLMFKHQCCFWRRDRTVVDQRIQLIPYEKPNDNKETTTPSLSSLCSRENPMYVPRRIPSHKRYLTIGIPTVKRRDGEYFMDMLSSMFNKTSEDELQKVVFVIFLADIENIEWKAETEAKIRHKYSTHINSGSLEVIQASPSFYMNMTNYGNNSYMKWRTKQNYDYAYMMKYSQDLSEYYMQMEDDVIASDGYFDAINKFIADQPNLEWVCLEFSELGFIGKVYHSKYLENLADMLLMFSDTQPVDYTYVYFNMLMNNGPRKIRKPTLFQHMGYHSSLSEKVQPLRDKFFDFPAKEYKGDNPTAHIYTSLKVSDNFPPSLAYSHENGHFWSDGAAKKDDVYLVVFDAPQSISRVVIDTGSKEHPGDIVNHGIVEACVSVSGSHDLPVCDNNVFLKDFENGKAVVNSSDISPKLGVIKVKGLQIRFKESQNEWVVIKEIAVFVPK
ncbi:hypothetical protein ACF0H5_015705 [Mactra antiquata]